MTLPSLAPDRASLPAAAVAGLYVHVPFCSSKCLYCDFYSIARQPAQRMDRYVDLVISEAQLWSAGRLGPLVRPCTVFIGGGTPTILPVSALGRLLAGLRDALDFSAISEWTVECNPATVSPESCALMRRLGVDRLSFGAQSFEPAELATLQRRHNPPDVARSIDLARQAGFRRLNLDLIYAIPGQDLASFSRSLDAVVALGTEHISCYALTYEPNTPLAVKRRQGRIQPVDDETELKMLHEARRRLALAGYRPYEISNYARPGEECRHNLLYWNGGNYIGLGPAAASHVEGWRWRNRPHLGQWEDAIAHGRLPASDIEHLTPIQRAGELIMLQLRLADGVRFSNLYSQSGVDVRSEYAPLVDRLEELGLLRLTSDGFALTDSGINVADAIAGQFIQPVPPWQGKGLFPDHPTTSHSSPS